MLFAIKHVWAARNEITHARFRCYEAASWNPHAAENLPVPGSDEEKRPGLVVAIESASGWLDDVAEELLRDLDMTPAEIRAWPREPTAEERRA